VLVEDGKACGVELENGENVLCDEVVINADFGHAMRTLFPGEKLGKYEPAALEKRKYSCSTFMMYLGLDRTYPDAEHHLIVFAQDYKKCLEHITKTKTLPDDLSLYVRNSVTLDPSVAPAGHSALYVLAPVPNNTSGIDWEKHKAGFRDSILQLLAERTPYKDLREHIREELIVTPADWEKQVSVFLGATFNMGHSWDQMLYFRPHNEFEMFGNTYLVGGGTHPGSGLPTIFESARISSGLICTKHGVPHPKPTPFAELGIA
jgi:phytoene desaturase